MVKVLVVLAIALTVGCKPLPVVVPCAGIVRPARPELPIKQWAPGKWDAKQLESILWQSLALEVGYSKALEEVIAAHKRIEK